MKVSHVRLTQVFLAAITDGQEATESHEDFPLPELKVADVALQMSHNMAPIRAKGQEAGRAGKTLGEWSLLFRRMDTVYNLKIVSNQFSAHWCAVYLAGMLWASVDDF